MALIILSPVMIFFQNHPIGYLRNILHVLFGFKSWVGYCHVIDDKIHLPKIRKGVLNPASAMKMKDVDPETAGKLNILYARDYNIWKDLNIILFALRDLGK